MELIIFLFLALVLFLYAVFLLFEITSANTIAETIDKICVIIPFRNEEKRIDALLKSIASEFNGNINVSFIFVDDNSNDESTKIISQHLDGIASLNIISNQGSGKKQAIDTALKSITGKTWVLTLDADVILPDNYGKQLLKIRPCKRFNVLQIHYPKPKNILSYLVLIEAYIQLKLFKSSTLINKPSLCSGAHLLYDSSLYKALKPYNDNFDIASGDDMFFLDACLKNNIEIGFNNLSVETEYPKKIDHFIAQRIRWLSKAKGLKSTHFYKSAILYLVLQVAMIISLIFIKIAWPFVIIKILIEFFYCTKKKSAFDLLLLLILPLFTLYQLCLPLLYIFGKNNNEANWK